MLEQDVAEEDLLRWEKVPEGAGTITEDFSVSLDQYGSLEALAKALQQRADELQAQIPVLESQVRSLTEQRDNAGAVVRAVKEMALQEVV